MALSVKGKVHQILAPASGTSKAGNEWKKQEFIIETDDTYPRKICFTLFGDKVDLINGVKAGETVEVSFDVDSREFNGRWFTNINAWKIDRAQDGNLPDPPPEFGMGDIPPERDDDSANDLPF